MRKYLLIFLFLFFVPFVYADTQIIKTDINITASSWIDNTANQSRMNITVKTESAEDPKTYTATNVNSVDSNNFIIRLVKEMNCNQTDLNKFINNTNSYFTNCEGGVCRERWLDCQNINKVLQQVKLDCESERNGCQSNLTQSNYELSSKTNSYTNCELERTKLADDAGREWWFGAIGVLIGGFAFYWFGDRTHKYKVKPSREEREGADISGEVNHPSDWNEGIGRKL